LHRRPSVRGERLAHRNQGFCLVDLAAAEREREADQKTKRGAEHG
jgi:hypothetical protein